VTTLPPLALSEPAQLDITGYRGDTHRFRVTVTQGGAPLDVSTAAWDADIRQTADGSLVGSMTVEPVAGQTNVVDVVLPAGITTPAAPEGAVATGPFVGVYDLEMTQGTAPDLTVTTLLRGTITLTRDVSRPAGDVPEGGGPPEPGPSMAVGAHLAPLAPGVLPERLGGPEGTHVPDPDPRGPR
jgi:hypothetical protein